MLKECIVYMLGYEQGLSSARRCQNGNMRSFRCIKLSVLSNLNAFLESCSGKASEHGLKAASSRAGNSDRLAGLFHKNGLHGTLEASDFDAVENFSPFLGALVETFRGISSRLRLRAHWRCRLMW